MRRRSLLLAAALPALPLVAPHAQGRLAVVGSFTILADMARVVGGDRVMVQSIAGPDIDAHVFQPRPSDAVALREAAVVVRNGLGFDAWLDRLQRSANWRGRVVTATEGMTPRMMVSRHNHGHGGGAERRQAHSVPPRQVPDPHGWQDLRLGQLYVRNIAAGLAAADPAGAATYRANAEAYLGRLAALDAWVRQQIGSVPEARRKVITSHDAFGYFAAAYGVQFLAPAGVSTDSEPSAADVARLIRLVREQNITALFMENMGNPATLDRLAAEAGVRVRGRLFADALSAADGPAPSYEAMFRHNLGLLVPAMRGDAA